MSLSVQMFLRTTSLDKDDRVMKEAAEVLQEGHDISIYVLESENKSLRGLTKDGVPFKATKLLSRIIPSGRFIAIKMFELHARMLFRLLRERVEVVWIHNLELAGMVWLSGWLRLLGRVGTVIWDQHELPSDRQLKSRLFRLAFKHLCEKSDNVIVANRKRGELLCELGLLQEDKFCVVENLASADFSNQTNEELPQEFMDWKGSKPFLVAQGASTPNRNFSQLLDALAQTQHRVVVIGGDRERLAAMTRKKYGDEFARNVYFTGWIPQSAIPAYLKSAQAGIILYSTETLNGKYCAPNRLYQALACELPVLVGCNPPLRSVVEELNCGVVLKTDGRDVTDLVAGIRKLESYESQTNHSNQSSSSQPSLFVFNIDDVKGKVKAFADILCVTQGNRRGVGH